MKWIQLQWLEGGIARLVLCRPERRNALSIGMRLEVVDALDEVAGRSDAKVLIITGSGAAFCAGFDLAEFADSAPEHQQQLWDSSDRFHHGILRFPLPTIAAVNGPALAGGFDLAVMCDLRVAARSAHFAHPERLVAEVVYEPLQELVGGAVARDLVFSGRSISAADGLALRLVNYVCDDALLESTTLELARSVAQAPRDVLVRMKQKVLRRSCIPESLRTLDL
jgi:enoyl-CoA hydratase/carnithine racemase